MRTLLWSCLVLSLVAIGGCKEGQHVVPFSGKVLYKDQPLTSGSVMFQPEGGIPARGVIQPDGTFVLTTYTEGDGATVGKNKVRIVSNTSVNDDPTQGEVATGTSVIPEIYNDLSSTPLTIEVRESGHADEVLVVEERPSAVTR